MVSPDGSRGMGVVYEARDRRTGERVALKTFRERSAADLRQLKHEFRALAAIHHPNVVQLHELTAEGDRWFLAMELVDGVDLVTYVRAGRGAARPDEDSMRRLLGGEGGGRAAGAAEEDLRARGVRDPARLSRVLAPAS